ncbi:MAG: DUF6515 family protein [Deltaproteobacteria bacterium]|jgi:uncharacterized protein YgiM (DUF1202 family)
METTSKTPLGTVVVISVGLFILTLTFTENALAFRRRAAVPVAPRHGTVIVDLPAGHRTVYVGRSRYFYRSGVFYRPGPSGYVVVRAPIGAVIAAPPAGCRTVVFGGATYYDYNGDYYQNTPGGYVVVEAPTVVPPAPATAGQRVSVTAHRLNVRSGPGIGHPVIEHVRQGIVLTVQGRAPGWLYVRTPSGKLGWVSGQYTVPFVTVPSG